MKKSEKVTMALFLMAAALSIVLIINFKGFSQLGNALSFLGGIGTIIPAMSQFRTNAKYIQTIKLDAGVDFHEIDRALENARREEFMRFSHFDYRLFSLGLVLICTGFLVSIVTAPNS